VPGAVWRRACAEDNRLIQSHARPFALCLFLLCLVPDAANAGSAPSHLDTIAGDLPASCSPEETNKLRSSIRELAAGRAPDDAWQLAHALICETGPEAQRRIAEHMTGRVASRTEGPGASEASLVEPDAPELREGYGRGAAWGARAATANDAIVGRFMTGETCWAGFAMRFDGKKWLVAELSGGCD
jgi:hypothetical protein